MLFHNGKVKIHLLNVTLATKVNERPNPTEYILIVVNKLFDQVRMHAWLLLLVHLEQGYSQGTSL